MDFPLNQTQKCGNMAKNKQTCQVCMVLLDAAKVDTSYMEKLKIWLF